MNLGSPLSVGWLQDANEAPDLALFFVRNVSPEYISHSELQGPRTDGLGKWNTGLVDIVRNQIEHGVRSGTGIVSKDVDSCPVLVARQDNQVIGLGMVSIFPRAPVPYAVIEDLVVDQKNRHAGIGQSLLEWIVDKTRAVGCERLFLESGIENESAHQFFKRYGFSTCSVVMMKPLTSQP